MAAPLSQDEIDALLTDDALVDDISADISEAAEAAATESETRSGKTKHFSVSQPKPFRYTFKYSSPVIKQSDMVIDPETENDLAPDIPVVRSMSNYAKLRALETA